MSEQGQRAGWYPDPAGTPGLQRWWNGIGWGEHTRPAQGVPTGQPGPGQPPAGSWAPGYGAPWAAGGSQPPRRSPVRWIVSGCLVLLLLAGLTVGGLVYVAVRTTSGPKAAVTGFFGDLREGRYDAAAGRLCSRYAAGAERRVRDAYPDPVLGYSATSVARTDDTATVVGELTSGSASAFEVTVTVVREAGGWRVCSLPG